MKAIDQVVTTVEGLFDTGDSKDVVSILKRDHRKVDSIFKQWSKARSQSKKMELMNQYIKNLTIHALVEEDLIYPVLEDSKERKTHSRTKEAQEEHHLLKMALADLADAKPGSEELDAKMQVVNELVKHHVKAEESELLPALKKSGVNLERLGQQVMQRKQQLMSDVLRASKSASTKKKSSTTRATASKTRNSSGAASSKKSAARKSTSGRSSAVKNTASGRSSTGRTAAKKRRTARKAA